MQNSLTISTSRGALAQPLSDNARKYVNASKAQSTLRAYRIAWGEFQAFCARHDATALPASPGTVVEYLTALADAGARVSTIQVKLAAIAFAHRSQADPNPARTEPVRILMQGIRRKLGCKPQQKAAVTRGELVKMLGTLPDGLPGKRDKAILLLGYGGAFRRSELVGLNVEDVRFGAADMTVTLRHSKTDQEGKGATKRIPTLDDVTLCPVRALKDWLDAAQIQSGAVFRGVDRWGHVRHGRLTDKVIALTVKRAATAAGLDARQFAGHSLRAGFVTQSARDNTPEWAIAEVTGHKSREVLRRYIRDAGLGQLTAIRRAFGEVGDNLKAEVTQ
jgi:integrase